MKGLIQKKKKEPGKTGLTNLPQKVTLHIRTHFKNG
jgi:hypothetical protein